MTNREKISPLKAKPLRLPGQSVQEEINRIITDKFLDYAMMSVFLFALAIFEWTKYFIKAPPHPIPVTIIAICYLVFTIYKLNKLKKITTSLKLGRDGERAVGEFLERLREDGCIVFHDIVGKNFNLDHVVLSTRGIFVIETKTYSKPKGKEAKVHYDGKHLNIDGLGNRDEILDQVLAESGWLKELLKESTGREFKIKPVILFPGWYVVSNEFDNLWVLSPKGLPKFIQNQREIFSKEDIKLAAYHLSRYIRVN